MTAHCNDRGKRDIGHRELGRIKLSNFNLLSHKVFILAICLRLSIIEIITFTSVIRMMKVNIISTKV